MAGACNALCNGCGPKKRDERMRENLLCVSQNVWKNIFGPKVHGGRELEGCGDAKVGPEWQ